MKVFEVRIILPEVLTVFADDENQADIAATELYRDILFGHELDIKEVPVQGWSIVAKEYLSND